MMGWMCEQKTFLHGVTAFVTALSLLGYHSALAQTIPTYYLDDYCSRTLDMTMANVKSGRIMLHRPGQNPIYPSCYMMITAPVNKRLTFKFHSFDIETPVGCLSNFLRLYEDHKRQFPITDRLCNSDNIPDKAFITNSNEAAVWLNKENYLLDQVELIFTAFSFSPCVGGDFQCDNDHCISQEFYCNDEYDNCGDESDICLLKHGTVVGIIVAVVVVVVILAVLLAVFMIRRQRKIRREKVAHILFANLDDKSQLSLVSNGKSSILKKQPSLLSHGSSVARYPGIRTIAFTGTKAHPLGYVPFVATGTPMSSPYSTLNRDGVILGSNLGEKTRSSIKSKPSKISRGKSDVMLTSSVRKRPSGELRPPFYFDKDGYFSDSSASQSNSLGKQGRRSSLDMTDARKKKKKRKFMGELKTTSDKENGGNSQRGKPTAEYGVVNKGYKDSKEVPGREQMTEDLYIDERRLVDTADVPEIHVTHAQEPNNRDQILNKAQSTSTLDRNYGMPVYNGPPARTSVRSAEALNQLMERRKEMSETPNKSEVSALKIQPRTMTSAVVHRPEVNAAGSDDNDSVNIETFVETPGSDTVDGRIQTPTHISVLTSPPKAPSRAKRDSRTSAAEARTDDDNIETVVESWPTTDTTVHPQTHISTINLPGTASGRRSQKSGESSTSKSNGEDEVDNFPQTNLQLADHSFGPRSRSSQDLRSSFTTDRSLSPTRQRGLSARHPDGSPYLLHKVSQKRVDKQLRQHPEDRADVKDHVVSFRSYPAPVHSLERAGLFRNSSRRSTKYSE